MRTNPIYTRRLIAVVALGVICPAAAPPAPAAIQRPRPALRNASASVEELIDRFIKALAAGDRRALSRLRVDKAEYLRLILPGTTEPGQPPKRYSSDVRRFAWDMLDNRCRFWESTLLNTYGGRDLTIDRLEYREGVKRYAGYTAYRQLALDVRDPSGAAQELRTGSIVEIDGRYKFISFVRD
jgi:hypothetical protein